MKLLALDTAGSAASVAVWQDGAVLSRSGGSGSRHHSEYLLTLVGEVMSEAGLELAGLDAIACGRGPGAFTGVRLAVGVAQGLAFAADRAVIPVSNLLAAAERALGTEGAPAHVLVCQDARMHEVYWAAYERAGAGAVPASDEAVGPPASVSLPAAWEAAEVVWGIGTGFGAYPALLERLRPRPGHWLALESGAEDIARVAARLGLSGAVNPEQAAPVYLRDDVAAPPASNAGHARP